MDTFFGFLFGTRTGVAVLFAIGVVVFIGVAYLLERRTSKIYVDRGLKDESEQDGFWD